MDASQIEQVLINMMINAGQAMPQGGKLFIKTGLNASKDHVYIRIEDTGCGIPEEDKKKLFNLEHHFTRKGTSGEEGTGLGLIICKEFLASHASSLAIESTPDEGSRFSFILPVKDKNT